MAIRTPEVLLSQAAERIEAGDVVSAGCYVKEAMRRTLRTLCDENGCAPTGWSREPWDYAMALCDAGLMTRTERRRINRMVHTCWRAAALQKIQPSRMRRLIEAARTPLVVPCVA